MPDPMTLDAALALLAGTGRVRIHRLACERQALNVVREELDARARRLAELEPDDGLDAGCPTGDCAHLSTAHEPDEYGGDGNPVRPICTIPIDGKPCPCGDEWRTT